MKRRLLALATTCLTGVAVPAAALADPPAPAAQTDDAPASETTGQPVAQPPAPARNFDDGVPKPPGDNVAIPTVNQTHTVVKGDTLWDLSQTYLGNPWYWPKVWSYNPQIANPHWIYPGNQVKFSATGGSTDDEAPAEAQTEGQLPDDVDTSLVSADKNIGYVAPTASSFRQDALITDRELEESGQIVRSTAETEMLDNLATIYCRFKSSGDARVGSRFFIFRTVRSVNHPITGKHFGYVTRVVGTAKVQGKDDHGMVTAVIDHTYDVIERGDYLAPYSDKLSKAVPQKLATREVHGYILDSLADQPFLGAHMVVFVDKGKRDGIQDGNVLAVTRQSDGLSNASASPGDSDYEDKHLPARQIGRLLVVDAKDDASTCLVLQTAREFVPGDRVVTVTTTGPVSLR